MKPELRVIEGGKGKVQAEEDPVTLDLACLDAWLVLGVVVVGLVWWWVKR